MANDSFQKIKIGLFVIGGLALLIAILFFLGMTDIFTNKATVQTFFSESVQGLTVGSAVKYRGVPIGNVTKISIRVTDKLVQVDMAVELEHFVSGGEKGQQRSDFRRFFQSELEQGMRCRLEYAGITGMRYIDFDYFATPGQTLPEPPAGMLEPGTLYIPAVPSPFRDILKAIGTSLDRISRIRFEEISDGLERSLSELSGLLGDPALKSTIVRINDAAENLELGSRTLSRVFSEERLNRLMTVLEEDLDNVNKLTGQLIRETRDAKLPESAAAFRDASNAISFSQDELANTLTKLNQTLDALTELADSLSADPSSIVSGKKKPQFKGE
ncbi:MCE family protein [Victivallaceae bacterium BBE-744-WT-12]|jgi:phospholipid/cholesterol/gamma-HCH transport system substrate-binding protein|uniref:MCE family protein n=1 Tax=Victivallis lenta TaxID=2606640 RepID=A0A844FZG0_9BACT|nr:MlaD family protein [Victivallis lenta]MBS1452014.1 MCE family protein [Lentisphaeria bacterium]MBS5530169.1 MCE family protein [bacterium]MST95748.1 MCE family protein [Victivallis lenta]